MMVTHSYCGCSHLTSIAITSKDGCLNHQPEWQMNVLFWNWTTGHPSLEYCVGNIIYKWTCIMAHVQASLDLILSRSTSFFSMWKNQGFHGALTHIKYDIICRFTLGIWITGWWFQTFFIFHNIWDNPSHWLIFFKMVKTTNQINYKSLPLGCTFTG